jgi:hypothetical protein
MLNTDDDTKARLRESIYAAVSSFPWCAGPEFKARFDALSFDEIFSLHERTRDAIGADRYEDEFDRHRAAMSACFAFSCEMASLFGIFDDKPGSAIASAVEFFRDQLNLEGKDFLGQPY